MSSHSSHLSQFDHTKINAQVIRDANLVVETHLVSDLVSGQRRVRKQKVWRVERVIGKGAFGEVRLEVLMEGSGEQRAVKRLWTSGSTLKREYQRELEALVEFSKLKYKEAAVFVDFLGWFEDSDSVYLAMEYIPLGDLEHNVPSGSALLVESEIRLITSQILEGLKIMHSELFVHRDLKPKNVLVCRPGPQWWVKLADFGLTKRRTEETAYRTQTGTESYMAPEILDYVPREDMHKSAYTTAVDLWALGCIVYRLASGVVPFPPGPSLYKFCDNPSGFLYQSLQLEQSGIEFIQSLLAPIPRDRSNVQQALDHPWMQISLDLDPTAGLVPFNNYEPRTTRGSTLDTGGYDTVTHAGLQSISATGPKGTHISSAYTLPPLLQTVKEESQPPLALGTATSNHSDSANIDESLDNSAQRTVADLAPRTRANVTAAGLTPPNRPQAAASSQLLYPVSAHIHRFLSSGDRYSFVIEAMLEDKRHWELQRYYEDFYDLHIALLTEFPAEAGIIGTQKRSLPYMPGPVYYVTALITEGRRHNLNIYLHNLLRQPLYISRCTLVRLFFAPRQGDFEITPNAPDRYSDSASIQQSSTRTPADDRGGDGSQKIGESYEQILSSRSNPGRVKRILSKFQTSKH